MLYCIPIILSGLGKLESEDCESKSLHSTPQDPEIKKNTQRKQKMILKRPIECKKIWLNKIKKTTKCE